MHEKFAKDGLVVVSVALDSLEDDPQVKEKILTFLQEKKATFTNLLLDEPLDVWQTRLQFVAPPAVYVFNRQGKWLRFEGKIEHDELEKTIVKLLNAK